MANSTSPKPRRARITPFRYGGYTCIANRTLLHLKRCPHCSTPITTMSKVKKAAENQNQDAALTWLCMVISGVKVMKDGMCVECVEKCVEKQQAEQQVDEQVED